MAERAIFLDRDNTIIEDKDGYIGDPAKVRLLPGSATAIASLRRLGYRIIVVSNQAGVARGYFSENDVESVNQEMCRQLREQAGRISTLRIIARIIRRRCWRNTAWSTSGGSRGRG